MIKNKSKFFNQLAQLVGKQNVLTDEVSLALYGYDCSLSRAHPDGVVLVKKTAWLAPIVSLCNTYRVPFTPRASATNHAGSCVALNGGLILNLTHLNHILEIDPKNRFAWVEPGVVTGHLQKEVAPLGLFYAPDPASASVCTIGGNVAQNASGARCLKYGGTLNHILAAEVVLPTGKTVLLDRTANGPDFIGLLTGSEGTLGILTKLKVNLLPLEQSVQTFLITFPSLSACVQAVTDLVAAGITPRCVEAMDQVTIQAVENFARAGYPTDAAALLLLELEGEKEQTQEQAAALKTICLKNGAQTFKTAKNEKERAQLWAGRRAAYGAMARLAPTVMVGDGTVPRSELPRALAQVRDVLNRYQMTASLLFHAGDGNFHPHLVFDENNQAERLRAKKAFKEILQVCVNCGGTVSGEHGVGVEKRAVMAYQYDKNTLRLFDTIKRALDPLYLENPLKIIPFHFAEAGQENKFLPPEIQRLSDKIKQGNRLQIVGKNTRLKTKSATCISSVSLNKILDIDKTNYTATVGAGVCINDLIKALEAQKVYCALAPSLGTVGGAFAGGQIPSLYKDIIGVEVLLADGSCVRYGGKLMKNAAGYNLVRLFAGSQGKLGLVTQLTLRIFAAPVVFGEMRPFVPFSKTDLFNTLKTALDPKGVFL